MRDSQILYSNLKRRYFFCGKVRAEKAQVWLFYLDVGSFVGASFLHGAIRQDDYA